MPRPGTNKSGKRKAGTTKSGILGRRRSRGAGLSRYFGRHFERHFERLAALARRFGKIAAILVITLWIGAWLWLSGSIHRGADWARHSLYDMSAQAGFAVQDVLVEGREYTDPDVLRALVNIERGDPVFMFKPRAAKELIERISWVREAHVQRRLPGTIYIGLIERVPLALWQHEGKIRVIDAEGAVLTSRDGDPEFSRFQDLLIVVGEDAPSHTAQITALLAAEPDVQARTEAAVRISGRRWDLTMKNGLTVKMPRHDPGLALRRLAAAHEQDGLLDKDLTMIDLREPDRIVVQTAPGAVQDYRAGGNAI